MKSFSSTDQATLLKSIVTIVGLGGLGGIVSEILARTGIGTLNLIDGDLFEESNLNRQFLCTENLLSKPKADAAAKRVKEINSSVTVRKYYEYLGEENADRIIGESGTVIDCLDSLTGRFILEKASKKAGCRLVSAAVAGSYGHITTIFPEDPGLKLIYGDPENAPEKGAETSLGALSFCVSLVASLEASEAIKIILKKGSLLRNKLLLVDLDGNTFETIQLL
ncbi:MAG: HesA/MoeB/ThiF family protein [Desulfobacteraceae bacterium]|nr:MAG: HesA/MoeB/ThiF family protein [Desulfobacteraceae bacterium]